MKGKTMQTATLPRPELIQIADMFNVKIIVKQINDKILFVIIAHHLRRYNPVMILSRKLIVQFSQRVNGEKTSDNIQ